MTLWKGLELNEYFVWHRIYRFRFVLLCLVVKPNHYVGIRLPWTLNDPKVWYQTNRLAGGLGIIIGLVIWLMPYSLTNVILGLVIFIAVPTLVAYRLSHVN